MHEKIPRKNILFKMLLLRVSFQLYSQEHTVRLVVKLLSPPAPLEYCGPGSNLVAYAPLLYTVLLGVTSTDTVHVLSLYGLVCLFHLNYSNYLCLIIFLLCMFNLICPFMLHSPCFVCCCNSS